MSTPEGWKNYDDFAAGIDTNRLPSTDRLAGRTFALRFNGTGMRLDFGSGTELEWSEGADRGADAYDAVEVAPDTYYIDIAFQTRPREALTLIVNTTSLRVLASGQYEWDRMHQAFHQAFDRAYHEVDSAWCSL